MEGDCCFLYVSGVYNNKIFSLFNQKKKEKYVGLVPPRGVNGKRDDVIPPHRPAVAQISKAQHLEHIIYEEDDAYFDGAGVTRAVLLPALPPEVEFTITSTIIQLFNLKGTFRDVGGADANQHLRNFVGIFKSQEIP